MLYLQRAPVQKSSFRFSNVILNSNASFCLVGAKLDGLKADFVLVTVPLAAASKRIKALLVGYYVHSIGEILSVELVATNTAFYV